MFGGDNAVAILGAADEEVGAQTRLQRLILELRRNLGNKRAYFVLAAGATIISIISNGIQQPIMSSLFSNLASINNNWYLRMKTSEGLKKAEEALDNAKKLARKFEMINDELPASAVTGRFNKLPFELPKETVGFDMQQLDLRLWLPYIVIAVLLAAFSIYSSSLELIPTWLFWLIIAFGILAAMIFVPHMSVAHNQRQFISAVEQYTSDLAAYGAEKLTDARSTLNITQNEITALQTQYQQKNEQHTELANRIFLLRTQAREIRLAYKVIGRWQRYMLERRREETNTAEHNLRAILGSTVPNRGNLVLNELTRELEQTITTILN